MKTRSSANAKRTAPPLQKYSRGTPNIWELPEPKAMPTFSYGCDFMMGLIGKPKLCTEFEVASVVFVMQGNNNCIIYYMFII